MSTQNKGASEAQPVNHSPKQGDYDAMRAAGTCVTSPEWKNGATSTGNGVVPPRVDPNPPSGSSVGVE